MTNLFPFLIPKSQVVFLDEDSTLRNGLEKLRHHGYTAIPVVAKDGRYRGTVTEGDFLWTLLERGEYRIKELEKCCVADLIRTGWNPPVYAYECMDRLFARLLEQNFVPVVDDRGVFIGIVTRKAVLGHCIFSELDKNSQKVHNSETF